MAEPEPLLPEPADPLGETLHIHRLTGTLYCRGEFTAPFAIAIPEFEGVMTFLVVTSGRCWLEIEGACHQTFAIGACSNLDGGEGFDIVQTYALAFARRSVLDDDDAGTRLGKELGGDRAGVAAPLNNDRSPLHRRHIPDEATG